MPRRDDTFIIYYAENFEEYETSNPSNLYCLSQSSIDIILSALRFATWPTRWRADRQDYRGKVSASEWQNLKKWGELAIQEVTYEMACDINEALAALNETLQSIDTKLGNLETIGTNTGDINTTLGSVNTSIGDISTKLEDVMGDLGTAVQYLADKLSGSVMTNTAKVLAAIGGCCEENIVTLGAGQVGTFTQGENTYPIYGTADPLSVPSGTWPDGFEDEPTYLADKCEQANLIVDGLVGTLRGLGALGVFNATALAALIVLAVTGVIILAPVALPLMAGFIGVLAVNVTLLTLAANEIESDRENWVCELYNSESVSEALAVIADLMDAIIATIGATSGPGLVVKQVVLLLCNSETLNQLFSNTAHVAYEGADCSACPEGPGLLVLVGSGSELIEPDNEWVTLTAENVGGSVWMVRLSDQVEDGGTGHSYICEWRNYTSSNTIELALGVEGPNNESVYGKYPAEIDDFEDPLEFNLRCGAWFQINSNFIPSGATQYTIEVRITDGC